MKLLKPSFKIVRWTPDGYDAIEESGRLCTGNPKSKTPEEQEAFIRRLVEMNHQTPFEQMDLTLRFVVDIGVGREALRHRITNPMQESTRYCKYKGGIKVIQPFFFDAEEEPREVEFHSLDSTGEIKQTMNRFDVWMEAVRVSEWAYLTLLDLGASAQEARNVLTLSTIAPFILKATIREWWHIFRLRALGTTGKPHPQMVEVMAPALIECQRRWPALFGHLATPQLVGFAYQIERMEGAET